MSADPDPVLLETSVQSVVCVPPRTNVLVVAAGNAPTPAEVARLPVTAAVVAVDAGLDHCLAVGLKVTAVVGDMDSVSPASIAAVERAGISIERYPAHKDQTDLELALETALHLLDTPSLDKLLGSEVPANQIIVLGMGGGRLDHLFGNLLVLASPRWSAVGVEAWLGDARAVVVRGRRILDLTAGQSLSLFAVGGPARVSTRGLAWELRDEVLEPFASRGISNQSITDGPQVVVCEGVVLAVMPVETNSQR
ncbi:MAG: thiamine diphosphokinase [Acidimicrobiia bacterium]|nr:thiamine diphosphokinase [Acidimicrobiia bacterium]MYC57957.1 thiamine diphosphokinase [Acidimicrobiia bacterium]MYG94645.1 thiamine diphosphokinase [Acidimicrobiia bacterium]MYI31094.1 thiamine diphosphokinase [Acidimicrobiia bacterium]